MRLPPPPHGWELSVRRAREIQQELAQQVRQVAPRRRLRRIAGVDAAFRRSPLECVAGVVVWDLSDRRVVERRTARRPLRFPYIPGLLSFREAPAVLAALRRLRMVPDLLLCDGHGLAHPRRFGIACHLGVLTGLASVGCAKSRLVGSHRDPGPKRGARCRLRLEGETVGIVLRTRDGVRPVFVSVGHRIDLATAVRVVLRCGAGYRLPEPTRLADRLVAAVR